MTSFTWDSSGTSSTTDMTWHNVTVPASSSWQTYKVTYYDPMEDYVPEPPELKSKYSRAPKQKTTDDPLDWLNERVAEITELVDI